MRSIDWAATPLGPSERWPQSLRTMIPAMLASSFAMRVLWGPQLIMLYNDAYLPVLGRDKHPFAMGHPVQDSFRELWHIVGPMWDRVLGGETISLDDTLLPLHRNGYLEECYFTLSYSPMRDDDGMIAGVLGVVYETTDRVLAERRLRALRGLAAHAAAATTSISVEATSAGALAVLADDVHDVPYALLYITDEDGQKARLAGTARLPPDSAAAQPIVAIDADGSDGAPAIWPLGSDGERRLVEVGPRFGALPGGMWPEPSRQAVVAPLERSGLQGFVVIGISPRRAFDDAYADFCDLAANQIATTIAGARSYAEERRIARRARLGSDVGAALTSGLSFAAQLDRCTAAVVRNLDADFAGIWILDEDEPALSLAAGSGAAALEAGLRRVPVGEGEVGAVAAERSAQLRNDVRRDGLNAFAGHPLIVGGRLYGVLALYSTQSIDRRVLDTLAAIVDSIAVGIERRRIEDERLRLLEREQSALAEAERHRSRLDKLFMQAPAAICVLRGRDHVYEFVNPRYRELVGERDYVGNPLRVVIPEVVPTLVPILDRVFDSGEPFFGNEYPIPLFRKGKLDDTLFNFIYQPIFDSDNAIEGIAVVAFEVTDQVHARQRSEQLAQALERPTRSSISSPMSRRTISRRRCAASPTCRSGSKRRSPTR